MHTMTTTNDDGPTVVVRGQSYALEDARELASELRRAADRIEVADPDAIAVLRVGAEVAGTSVELLAEQAGLDATHLTRRDAQMIAFTLGLRKASRTA